MILLQLSLKHVLSDFTFWKKPMALCLCLCLSVYLSLSDRLESIQSQDAEKKRYLNGGGASKLDLYCKSDLENQYWPHDTVPGYKASKERSGYPTKTWPAPNSGSPRNCAWSPLVLTQAQQPSWSSWELCVFAFPKQAMLLLVGCVSSHTCTNCDPMKEPGIISFFSFF